MKVKNQKKLCKHEKIIKTTKKKKRKNFTLRDKTEWMEKASFFFLSHVAYQGSGTQERSKDLLLWNLNLPRKLKKQSRYLLEFTEFLSQTLIEFLQESLLQCFIHCLALCLQ